MTLSMPRNPRKKAAPKKTRRTSYKKKSVFTLKNIIAGLVATVVIVGGAAAFALSQTNQDTRSAAYIPNESCGSLGKNDCPGVPGCSWQETESTLKCNNFETDACPSECHLVTAYTKCKPGYYVAPNGQASNCSQFSSSECTSKGCTLETVKACAGGEFTRAGAGKCTGTPKGSGSGGSSGGSTGGNSGGGSDSGGSSGGSTGGNSGGGGSSSGGSSNTGSKPKGFFDVISDNYEIRGWTCDADDYNTPLEVHFYIDGTPGKGTFIGKTTASVAREAAVGKECGGRSNSGYTFKIPTQYLSTASQQTRKVYAYAINIGPDASEVSNPQLSNSPKSFKTAVIDTTPPAGKYSSACTPATGQTAGDLRYTLSVSGTKPNNIGAIVYYLGFYGKQHSKELTDDFLGKPTWSDTCYDQGWCGYWLKQVNDPNPNGSETITWTWDGSFKQPALDGKTINDIANKIAELKKQGKLAQDYKLAIHAEYRLLDGSKYKFEDKYNTQLLDISPTACGAKSDDGGIVGTPPSIPGVIAIRARGTLAGGAYPIMELRHKGIKWTSWSVTNTMQEYKAEIPNGAKVSDMTVHFVNDYYNPTEKQDRNLEVDYLKFGNTVYQSEAPSTYSDGSWAAGSCAPGNKQSQWLHCGGYFKYAQ